MSPISQVLALFEDALWRRVELAMAAFRSGRPVALIEGEEALVVLLVDALTQEIAQAFDALRPGKARLLLSAARLRRLGCEGRQSPGAVRLENADAARVEALSFALKARLEAPLYEIDALEGAGIELARLAQLTPALFSLGLPALALPGEMTCVTAGDLRAFRQQQCDSLAIIARAPVPLEGVETAEFVVFRGGDGLKNQIAIVVGKPDLQRPVAVRLHSACLTGDLFGSLKCDCGDQLRSTVQQMATDDGGILLYLDQEGRGNGIANKMRAYRLQVEGWDTYDADEILGFGLDQRRFDFAAAMLRQLGVGAVRVMTNNPEKILALRQAGIEVAADKRAYGRQTPENRRYLAAKRDRAGHMIDLEAMHPAVPMREG